MNSDLIRLANVSRLIENSNKKGYRIYEGSKPFDLNIHVIRSNEQRAGKFDDIEVLFWKDKEEWKSEYYSCTADPSDLSLINFKNKLGCAIILPGQYKSSHILGFHKQDKSHPALVQYSNITVIRDYNKDTILDYYPKLILSVLHKRIIKTATGFYTDYLNSDNMPIFRTDYGMLGINNHRASAWKILESVGLYSEGCIVQNNPQRYNGSFIPLLKEAAKIWGGVFSITIHTEEELRNI